MILAIEAGWWSERLAAKAAGPHAVSPVSTSRVQRSDGYAVNDGIATIDVTGPLLHGDDIDALFEGGTSYQWIHARLDDAMRDPTVRAVLLRYDSPGGDVHGMQETASAIRAAASSGRKPVVSFVSGKASSAAYLLAAAGAHVVAAPGSHVGSVGVVIDAVDTSELEKTLGLRRVSVVSQNAPLKRAGIADSDEGRADAQDRVDHLEALLHKALAEYRGVSVTSVKSDFGSGGVLEGSRAKRAGMVDSVGLETDLRAALAANPRSRKFYAGAGAVKMDELNKIFEVLGADDTASALGKIGALKSAAADLAEARATVAKLQAAEHARGAHERDRELERQLAAAIGDGRLRAKQQSYVADRARGVVHFEGGRPIVSGATADLCAELGQYAAHLEALPQERVSTVLPGASADGAELDAQARRIVAQYGGDLEQTRAFLARRKAVA